MRDNRDRLDFDKIREITEEFNMKFVTTSVVTLFNDDIEVVIGTLATGVMYNVVSIDRGVFIPNKYVTYAEIYYSLHKDLSKIAEKPKEGIIWKVTKAIEQVDGVDAEDRAKLIQSAVDILSPIEKKERLYIELVEMNQDCAVVRVDGCLMKVWEKDTILNRLFVYTVINGFRKYIRLHDIKSNRNITITLGSGTYINN